MNSGWLSWLAMNYPAVLSAVFAGLAFLFARLNRASMSAVFAQLEVLSLHLQRGKAMSASLITPIAPIGPISTDDVLGAGGGSSSTPPFTLSALPAWSEQSAIGDDGAPANQHDNLCGEVCVSAIVAAVHGVPTDPTDHRTHAHGLGGSALTTADDVQRMLQHCSVGATGRVIGWGDAHMLITARLAEGCYTVVLIAPSWVGFVLHWVVPVGHGVGGYNVYDPWTGTIRTVSDNDMARWYGGQIVTTSAHPHYDATLWVMPPN